VIPSRMRGLSSATAPKSSRTIFAVPLHQQIPGVRIGVVDAIDEDHLAVQAHEAPCDLLLVDAQGVERCHVADLDALDERRRQDAPGAQPRIGSGKTTRSSAAKFFAIRSMLSASSSKSSSCDKSSLIWW
jgi:hypothetical protein